MLQLNLRDKTFYYLGTTRYQNSIVSDRYSKYFEWVSDRPDLPTFFTYLNLDESLDTKYTSRNALLVESSSIIPFQLKWVHKHAGNFMDIYTHNSELLKLCKRSRWIPGGGIWIGTEFGGGEVKIYGKTKLCSFVSSDKQMCDLHKLRWSVYKYIMSTEPAGVELFGAATGKFVKAIEYLRYYRFSIVFENNIDDLYFTEKILNCFATGTIPIYLGARNISSVFDADGIIQFSSAKELLSVLPKLTNELYESKIRAVEHNFNVCQQFACIEDFMWENYVKENYERWNNYK